MGGDIQLGEMFSARYITGELIEEPLEILDAYALIFGEKDPSIDLSSLEIIYRDDRQEWDDRTHELNSGYLNFELSGQYITVKVGLVSDKSSFGEFKVHIRDDGPPED